MSDRTCISIIANGDVLTSWECLQKFLIHHGPAFSVSVRGGDSYTLNHEPTKQGAMWCMRATVAGPILAAHKTFIGAIGCVVSGTLQLEQPTCQRGGCRRPGFNDWDFGRGGFWCHNHARKPRTHLLGIPQDYSA